MPMNESMDPNSPFARRPEVASPGPWAPPPDYPPPPRRRPAPPAQPSVFASIDWDGFRRKGWSIALTLASAYVASKPEKFGWLAPVLTAAAAVSKPPQAANLKTETAP